MMPKKATKAVRKLLTNLRDVQIDLSPAHFDNATDLKAAYDATDTAVKNAAVSSVDKQVELIAALAQMRSLLSQRGDGERLRRDAGIKMGWVEYFAWFKRTYKYHPCLRTVINHIDRLNGKKRCKSCGNADGHTPSCRKHKSAKQPLDNRVKRLVAGVDAGHDLVKAIEQGGNVPKAVREFKYSAPSLQCIEEWVGQEEVPYEPHPGDLLLIHGIQMVVRDIQGVKSECDEYLLTLAVEPVRGEANVSRAAKMPPTKAPTDSDDDDSICNAAVA
jgi:ribosomal protein L34E